MAAANQFCEKKNYDINSLQVLIYNQELSKSQRIQLTALDGLDIDNPVKAITKSELQNLVKAINQHTCDNIVSEDYIRRQLTTNTIYMILFDRSDHSVDELINPNCKRIVTALGKPVSFILAHLNDKDDYGHPIEDEDEYPKKESYIDIVCACPGSGRHLIDYFINYSEKTGYRAVSLRALPTVLAYYPKFGFVHKHSCKPGEKTLLTPEILSDKKYRDKRYLDIENIYNDDDHYLFLKELKNNGYGRQDRGCEAANITKEDLKSANCGTDGYMMRRCR